MAKFRIDSIATLARQMQFTPLDLRAQQIDSAEDLLHSLDAGKAYPLDYVIFRITGYHPKKVAQGLLTGIALQHDLGLLIERVSEALSLHSRALAQPVLTIEDVTEKFSVTSKTIQRWRRRGLPARRFIFTDGKRRVGFLLSSVERFLSVHGEQVSRGTNFSQMDDSERQEILRRASRLAGTCGCCETEISRRIARRLNRSPLTIRYTIRKHDEEHPEQAIFVSASAPLTDEQRGKIVRLHRRGLTLRKLARRFARARAQIYRVLIEDRLNRLNRRKARFFDDPLYHQTDAEQAIEAIAAPQQLSSDVKAEELRIPRDLPPYLADLYRTPLLSPKQERGLFLKYNFHKMRFVQARRRVEPHLVRKRDLEEMERHWRRAIDTKNQIVQANLRLVVSIARKHLRPGLSLMELVSEGNITLMRAAESFDVHRGNRFSTYATLALMKGFARTVPQMLSQRSAGTAGEEGLLEAADTTSHRPMHRLLVRDEVRQMLSRLDDRERHVVRAHFGLDESAPATYEQVGERLGLSKERVRQIEQKALGKLRATIAIKH